jgi:hypothetical protein
MDPEPQARRRWSAFLFSDDYGSHRGNHETLIKEVQMAKQTKAQKDTVERVMHEFKEGELRIRGTGPKVKNPKQAIAIALHEAGASNQESPAANREALRKTKAKERQASAPTKPSKKARRTSDAKPSSPRERLGKHRRRASARTWAELYAEAKRRDVPGRSRMSKEDLERALR